MSVLVLDNIERECESVLAIRNRQPDTMDNHWHGDNPTAQQAEDTGGLKAAHSSGRAIDRATDLDYACKS